MKITPIIMIVLAVLGALTLGIGIVAYVNAVNSGEVLGTFFGMLFSFVPIIIGGVILLVDLVILVVFLSKRRKVQA